MKKSTFQELFKQAGKKAGNSKQISLLKEFLALPDISKLKEDEDISFQLFVNFMEKKNESEKQLFGLSEKRLEGINTESFSDLFALLNVNYQYIPLIEISQNSFQETSKDSHSKNKKQISADQKTEVKEPIQAKSEVKIDSTTEVKATQHPCYVNYKLSPVSLSTDNSAQIKDDEIWKKLSWKTKNPNWKTLDYYPDLRQLPSQGTSYFALHGTTVTCARLEPRGSYNWGYKFWPHQKMVKPDSVPSAAFFQWPPDFVDTYNNKYAFAAVLSKDLFFAVTGTQSGLYNKSRSYEPYAKGANHHLLLYQVSSYSQDGTPRTYKFIQDFPECPKVKSVVILEDNTILTLHDDTVLRRWKLNNVSVTSQECLFGSKPDNDKQQQNNKVGDQIINSP